MYKDEIFFVHINKSEILRFILGKNQTASTDCLYRYIWNTEIKKAKRWGKGLTYNTNNSKKLV
jgi:hypothetical protein